MKRDIDLVRKILLALEEHGSVPIQSLEIVGYEQEAVDYHLWILADSPYVHFEKGSLASAIFVSYRLTWQGHEFLETIRDDARWKQLKEASTKAAATSTEAIAKAALDTAIKLILRYMGLPT